MRPHPGDLTWADGRAPTPHGAVEVRWSRESGSGGFSMTVTVPQGTTGTIAVPLDGVADPTVLVDGQVVWADGSDTADQGLRASAAPGFVEPTGVQPGTYQVTGVPGKPIG